MKRNVEVFKRKDGKVKMRINLGKIKVMVAQRGRGMHVN